MNVSWHFHGSIRVIKTRKNSELVGNVDSLIIPQSPSQIFLKSCDEEAYGKQNDFRVQLPNMCVIVVIWQVVIIVIVGVSVHGLVSGCVRTGVYDGVCVCELEGK